MLNLKSRRSRAAAIRRRLMEQVVWERRLAGKAVPLLARQARAAAAAFERSGSSAAAISASDRFASSWRPLLSQHYRRIGKFSEEQVSGAIKSAFGDLEQKAGEESTSWLEAFRARYARFVTRMSARKVKGIQAVTRLKIRAAIEAARVSGGGNYEIAKAIFDKISGTGNMNARLRCRTIARTETHMAMNASTHQAMEESDVVDEKEWGSTEDERTRPSHARADGQRVKMGERFKVGGALLKHPGDPDGPASELVNCRCIELFHF